MRVGCDMPSDPSQESCRYLIALIGARLHFCGARQELAPPGPGQLQRHCLGPGHTDCPILLRIQKTGRLVSHWEYVVETEGAARKPAPARQADTKPTLRYSSSVTASCGAAPEGRDRLPGS
jgi:hypothetical protein